ncbi:hypothetical protein [Nonlabens ponticola]|uniref:hypothetical protein n=1 Tax=Nonlabens ponticola TaxID=2496866 RepID=UPI0013DFD207|nr:hypothetical protein [Nonlabens ponticola]
MKAQEGKSEKEVRKASIEKKMAHDAEAKEELKKGSGGYGSRDYKNNAEEE